MIRIHLLGRQESQVIAILMRMLLLVGSGALLVSAVYLVDRQFPILQLWSEMTSSMFQSNDEEPSPEPVATEYRDPDIYDGTAPSGEATSPALRDQQAAATARTNAAAKLNQRKLPAAPRPLATAVAAAAPVLRPLPKSSRACAITVGLLRHAPSGARVTSLMGRGDGSYTIEGSGISQSSSESWRDQLLEESTEVRLTVWTQAKTPASSERRFSYTGRVKQAAPFDLAPVTPKKSTSLLRDVSSWARTSGIRSLTVEGPIAVALNQGLSKHRQKIWGRGSYDQIAAFTERLVEAGELVTLSELVMVPVYRNGEPWQSAHMYAVVDVLVR